MAKRKTILDFFSSPKVSSPKLAKKSQETESPNQGPLDNGTVLKRPRQHSENSPESEEDLDKNKGKTKPKRRRLVIASDSDDSADEYKPGKREETSEDSDSANLWEDFPSDVDSEPEKKKKNRVRQKNSRRVTKTTSKVLNSPQVLSQNGHDAAEEAEKEWTHLSLEWLKEGKLRDKKGRPTSHSDYDPSTLYVPDSFKKSTTPALRQWWEMKADHFDTVLFFKVGKFYELYHMDAVVGVSELGLIYMKGEFAHSGFPEIAYGRYSSLLVEKGYKVARVEQTETPQMMEERCKKTSFKTTKFDKVVAREICQITTKGTKVFSYQEGKPMGAGNHYLICITEMVVGDSCWSESEYGVCFIDTSVGKFYIGQFSDDRHCSRLRTLIAHYTPVEILYDKDSLSKKTTQFFHSSLGNVKQSPIGSSSQFWDCSRTLKLIINEKYFCNKQENGSTEWPTVIKDMLDESDLMLETPKREFELAMKAFSGCFWYLKTCLIEEQLLTMKLFEKYVPLDNTSENHSLEREYMILDSVTLNNLEILHSEANVGATLIHTIDFCSTPFGKRLLRQWLCAPLCNPKAINDRLDALEDLEKNFHVVEEVLPILKKLPDLERLLSRIHAQGLLRSKDHPDSRAIFYEEENYTKRKIMDLLSTLEGFKFVKEVFEKLEPLVHLFKSQVLSQTLTFKSKGGLFPYLDDVIQYFDEAFDHEKAKRDGCIIPNKNLDEDYDFAIEQIDKTLAEFDSYLSKQKKKYQCKITYVGTGRNRYQLEIPENAASEADSSYQLQSQRKGFKRFYTSFIREHLAALSAAEERRDAAKLDILRRIFAKFDEHYRLWSAAVLCISVLDVLISLTIYKQSSPISMCRPVIKLTQENNQPLLKIFNGQHPSLVTSFVGDCFTPTSIYLGPKVESANVNGGGNIVLVTGPNMGGKSTLIRQTGLIVILAQLGSYVPAEKCLLTPVDRVFTRIGANDNINAGESTFFVEVSEASTILHHATSDSLVLIDELGRGTSTHDGTSVACAVVNELVSRICSRTLFSTHYHNLVEDFVSYPNVGLGHMACMVEEDDNHPVLENITFLYKFMDGICPKSYGFNVAHLAGISAEIVQNGFKKAKAMEKHVKFQKMYWNLLTSNSSTIVKILEETQSLLNQYCSS